MKRNEALVLAYGLTELLESFKEKVVPSFKFMEIFSFSNYV